MSDAAKLKTFRERAKAAERDLAEANAAIRDALDSWTFDERQWHTHSWHDLENWKEKHSAAIKRAKEGERGTDKG